MPVSLRAPLLVLVLAGCGGSDGPVPFAGVLAGAGDIGRIELTLGAHRRALDEVEGAPTEPAPPVPAAGRLVLPSGAGIPLAGNYDPPSETMYLSGGGYVLGAYLEHDLHPAELVFEGYYRGPAGGGRLTLHEGAAEEVGVLCGEFSGSATGRWAVVLGPRFSTAIAVPFETTRRSLFLVGSVSAGEASYEAESEYGEPAAASATAVIASDLGSAQGSWTEGVEGGEWAAAAAGCAIP